MLNQPVNTFHRVLHTRNKSLYYKWLYHGELTNCEKDELEICARIARNLTGDKEL